MAVLLTGTDLQYVQRTPGLGSYNSSYIFMGWFRLDQTGLTQGLFYNNADTSNYDSVYLNSSNQLVVEVNNAGTSTNATGSTVLTTGTWYHIAMHRTAITALTVVLDGTLEATATTAAVTGRSTNVAIAFGIHLLNSSHQFVGAIADIKNWSTFAATRIGEERNRYTPKNYQNFLLFWPLYDASFLADMSQLRRPVTLTGSIGTDRNGPPIRYASGRRRIPMASAVAAPTFFFRKSLSGIGTRTGSRQVHGWGT